jgi:hypothetical protein
VKPGMNHDVTCVLYVQYKYMCGTVATLRPVKEPFRSA